MLTDDVTLARPRVRGLDWLMGCPAPLDEGRTGGIPGLDEVAVVLGTVVDPLTFSPPGVTAAAASLTRPMTPPKSPPAAWPTWFMAPPIEEPFKT